MKKILSVFAMMAMLFASCTPEDQPGNEGGNENEGGTNNGGENTEVPAAKPELKLTSSNVIEFTAEGGEGTISYVLKNPVEGVSIAATCEADWVTSLTPSDKRTTFVVAPYEATDAPRQTVITITYGELSEEVTVHQDAALVEVNPDQPDVEFTAPNLFGVYFGNQYSEGYNYYINLTDGSADYGEGWMVDIGTHYILDIYSDVPVGDGENVLPLGTYEFDANTSGAPGTFSLEYSAYLVVAEDMVQEQFTSGTITVTENKIELIAVINNKTHKVTYEGSLLLSVPSTSGGGEITEPLSNLTGDLEVVSEKAYFQAVNFGDAYEIGLDCWEIMCVSDIETFSGDMFVFEVLTPLGSGFAGAYPGFFSNTYDGSTNIMLSLYNGAETGTFYATVGYDEENGLYMTEEFFAPLVAGEMLIEYDAENTACGLQFVGIDDAYNNVSVSMVGYIDIYDETTASAAKKSSFSKGRKVRSLSSTLNNNIKKADFVLAR